MQIVTNKNLDTYQDDFFKGLTLAQTVSAVAVLISAGAGFLFFYVFLQMPMSAAIYLALPFALPFAVGGFLKIHGMSPFVYLQKKKKVTEQCMLRYIPAYVSDSREENRKLTGKKSRRNSARNSGRNTTSLYLETEEEIHERMKGGEALSEKQEIHEGL